SRRRQCLGSDCGRGVSRDGWPCARTVGRVAYADSGAGRRTGGYVGRTLRFAAGGIMLVLALAAGAAAQLASQTALVGTVTDSGGGVLPGAAVTAVNVDAGDTYNTVTNDQGQYNIPAVRLGTYEITIALDGFQTFKAT